MKRQFLNAMMFFFVFINCSFGQTDFFLKRNKSDAMKLIEALNTNNKITQVYISSLERAITNYVSYHFYAPKEADRLFHLIIGSTHSNKNEYFRFLLMNAEYFSQSQIEFIKVDLERVIKKSDYQFYDIVSIYHLDTYKAIVVSAVDTAYLKNLRTAFYNKAVSIGLLEKAKPLIALANLGDLSIEDSIINIVGEFYAHCLTTEDSLAQKIHYIDMYFMIVPKLLAKLNSKRSVELTAYLMLDDYAIYLDGVQSSVYELYINSVVTPKVNGYDYSSISMTMFDFENKDLIKKRTFVNNLNNRIKNRELSWKKTLNDVDK